MSRAAAAPWCAPGADICKGGGGCRETHDDHLHQGRKTNVADTVIDQITALIRSGALKPGDRLPTEHGLSRQLGVGRSSVREALKALEVLGLVRRGQDGSFISEESSSLAMSKVLYTDLMARQLDIVHLYEARQFLETHLGALATENLSEDDSGELRSLCEAMEATPDHDIRAHVKLDRTFHGTLCELAGNPVLTRLWELCFSVLVEIRRASPSPPRTSGTPTSGTARCSMPCRVATRNAFATSSPTRSRSAGSGWSRGWRSSRIAGADAEQPQGRGDGGAPLLGAKEATMTVEPSNNGAAGPS